MSSGTVVAPSGVARDREKEGQMRRATFAVRPVRIDDVAALRRLFVGSTPEACRALAHDVDGALVALDGDVVVGVARWHRLVAGGDEAEVAVFVADPWRGRGIGSQLVADIERLAGARGLRVSTSTMLGDAAA
jgi:GNAT superfamily N-acetyltransferase